MCKARNIGGGCGEQLKLAYLLFTCIELCNQLRGGDAESMDPTRVHECDAPPGHWATGRVPPGKRATNAMTSVLSPSLVPVASDHSKIGAERLVALTHMSLARSDVRAVCKKLRDISSANWMCGLRART